MRMLGEILHCSTCPVSSASSRKDLAPLFSPCAWLTTQLHRFGAVAPILVLHLRHLGFSDQLVGSFLSLTLLGDVLLSLVVT